jgi:hypothetical protein
MNALKHAKIVFESDYPVVAQGRGVCVYLSHDVIEAVEKLSNKKTASKSRIVDYLLRQILFKELKHISHKKLKA